MSESNKNRMSADCRFPDSPSTTSSSIQILRLMKGYDKNNVLLLPPRVPGETLPPELLDYYKAYCSQWDSPPGGSSHVEDVTYARDLWEVESQRSRLELNFTGLFQCTTVVFGFDVVFPNRRGQH